MWWIILVLFVCVLALGGDSGGGFHGSDGLD